VVPVAKAFDRPEKARLGAVGPLVSTLTTRVIEAAFFGAQKLFGMTFKPVDVPVWHPDVRSWEVRGADGGHVGIFYGDYFARPSKQGGAWMGTLRDQEKLAGNIRPIVLNVMNFNKGDPTLLSFEDARTLFHEMGHGLHGLLSNVTYPTVSCTSVLTDCSPRITSAWLTWLTLWLRP